MKTAQIIFHNILEVVRVLSEFSVAGIYLPPFFVYACAALPIYLGIRSLLTRYGALRWVWHPGLFGFALSLCIVSMLILFV